MKTKRVWRRLNSYGIYGLTFVIVATTVYSVAALV